MHDHRPPRAGIKARDARTARTPQRGSGLGSAIFYCAMALVMIVLAVGTFVVVAAPVDLLRDRLIAEVKARTGRDLTVGGRSSLSVYPALGMSFGDVTLSPPPGMAGPPTVIMAGLDVSVAIWPLLSREVVVQRLVLRQPVIRLETDARGRRSWDFGSVSDARVQLAQATSPARQTDVAPPAPPASPPAALAALKALELRIEQGTVDIVDARQALAERISGIDLRASYRGISNPLAVQGQAVVRGEPLDLDLKFQTPDRLADGQLSKLDALITGRALKARFEGQFAPAPIQIDGNLDVDAATGAPLANLLRRPGLAEWATPVKVAAMVRATEGQIAFNNARFDLEPLNATGTVSVETAGQRPIVRANLRVTELDVPRLQALAVAMARPVPPPTAASAAPATSPRGIGDLIERTATDPPAAPPPAGTRVRGFLKRADWSDAPLDFAALGLIDADARIAASRVVLTQTKLGPTQATVSLRNGVLRVNIEDTQLYEGRARGIVAVDVSGRTPAVSLNLNADGIAVQPFLRDVADSDRISGRGRLTLALVGSGTTERRLMQSLEGKGDLLVTNGAVAGLDGMQQVLGILQGRPGGASSGRTEFSELAGSVVVTAGVARNSDLRLVGSGLRVTGSGDIDIGQRQVDYLFKPRADAVSLEVPVRARGPWDDVRWGAEMNREKAVEALRDLGRQFNGQNVGDVVRDLTKPGENGEPSKAQKFLDRFLKR